MPAPIQQSAFVNAIFKLPADDALKFVFPSSLAAGTFVIGAFAAWHYAATDALPPLTGTALTDQLGNSYTILSMVQTGNNSHHFMIVFAGFVVNAGAPTISASWRVNDAFNSAKGRAAAWDVFSGSPADKITSAQGGLNSTGVTTGAQTLTNSAPWMMVSAFSSAEMTGAMGAPAGLTVIDNNPSSGASNELSFAWGYADDTTATNAGPSQAWTCPASPNGTVGTTVFFKLACRVRALLQTAATGATGCTVDIWPSGDPKTSLAVGFTGVTVGAGGVVLVPADPAWGKAVGTTVAVDVTGTDATAGSSYSGAGRFAGTIELGVA